MAISNISLAPIQGITDYVFRNHFERDFSGVSKLYTPFIRYQNERVIKKSHLIDIDPKNNNCGKVIPQILSNNSKEILHFAHLVHDYGYTDLNWNLGCPYPMVAKRKMGSGLLPFPVLIEQILNEVFVELPIRLSIKMRLGFENNTEILQVLPILNRFPLSEIIIHPRIGKQMYRGSSDIEMFETCRAKSIHELCYNGDINDTKYFNELNQKLGSVSCYMIGRGAISNPFLIEEIKGLNNSDKASKLERFNNFHNSLFESYSQILSGPGHIIIKMQQLWEYFSNSFENPHKVKKLVKKANTLEKYHMAIYQIFNNFEYIA